MTEKMAVPDQYWSHPVGDLLAALGSTSDGLGSAEAGLRLAQVGPNVLEVQEKATPFRSKPGKYLLIGTMLVAAVTLLLPYSPLGKLLGFTPLPLPLLLVLLSITGLYVLASEAAKRAFYRRARL